MGESIWYTVVTMLTSYLFRIQYAVQDIFRIERNGEDDRFSTSGFKTYANSDRRLLWHGSRVTNYGGILKQGLRIAPPEAPVSGYMCKWLLYLYIGRCSFSC
jgi:poly [ADP-ribose] polymerase 2/3/4